MSIEGYRPIEGRDDGEVRSGVIDATKYLITLLSGDEKEQIARCSVELGLQPKAVRELLSVVNNPRSNNPLRSDMIKEYSRRQRLKEEAEGLDDER